MEKIIGKIIDVKKDDDKVNNSQLVNLKVPGVWGLIGQKADQWYWLQLAGTNNMKDEIKKDWQLLLSDFNTDRKEIFYVNQFKKKLFSYPDHPNIREYLYSRYIRNEFESLKFVVVYQDGDKDKWREIEKEIAHDIKPICWRNGRSFKDGEKIVFNEESIKLNGKEITEYINDFIAEIRNKYGSM